MKQFWGGLSVQPPTPDDDMRNRILPLVQQALEDASIALEKFGDEHTRGLVRSALIEIKSAL